MMISPHQIKAARAMLDWSQDMLAQEAGVSPATVFNFEKGHQSFASAKKLRQALENKGFEFIGTQGINRAERIHITYTGSDSAQRFYDDMLETAKNYGGEIAAIYKTPKLLLRSLGVPDFTKLDRLEKLSKFAKIRCLLSDTKNAGLLTSLLEAKAISQHPFEPLAIFICGNSFTVIIPNDGEIGFYVTKSIDFANAEMINFMKHWNTAVPLVIQAA